MASSLTLIDILDNHTLYDNVLDFCSPVTIFRLQRSCRSARAAIQDYRRRAFNINRHLKNFFDNPLDFRRLQSRTSAIVSGANALEFFDRTRRQPSSDLDIYVVGVKSTCEVSQWLLSNGYALERAKQRHTPPIVPESEDPEESHFAALLRAHIAGDTVDEDASRKRLTSNAENNEYEREVLIFSSTKRTSAAGGPLRVRVTVSWFAPIESILSFHYTSAMNFYTHAAAYSLYPRGTFEHQLSLYCDTREARYFPNYPHPERYTMCGREIIPSEMHLLDMAARKARQGESLRLDVHPGQRRVGDAATWVIPFSDAHEIQHAASEELANANASLPPAVSSNNNCMVCRDPITLNSFAADFNLATGHFVMHFAAVCDERLVPSYVAHKEEMCFVISQALSPKLRAWQQSVDFEWSLRDPSTLLSRWTDVCLRKCTCNPFRHNKPEVTKACPASLELFASSLRSLLLELSSSAATV